MVSIITNKIMCCSVSLNYKDKIIIISDVFKSVDDFPHRCMVGGLQKINELMSRFF